jgi:hypothetical protein
LSYKIQAESEGDEPSPADLIKSVIGWGLKCSDIQCIQKNAKYEYTISFKAGAETYKIPPDFQCKGKICMVNAARDFNFMKFHRNRHVAVFNLPTELGDENVLETFHKYGNPKRVLRGFLKEYPNIENGVRTVVMESNMAPVPRFIYVKGNRFRTSYTGQESHIKENTKCFLCGELGHVRRDCIQSEKEVETRQKNYDCPKKDQIGTQTVEVVSTSVENDESEQNVRETMSGSAENKESDKEESEMVCEEEVDSEDSEGEKLIIDLGQDSEDNGTEGLSESCKDGGGKDNGVVRKNIQEFEGRATPNPGVNGRGARCSGTVGELVPAPRYKRGRGDKSDSETSPSEKQVTRLQRAPG